MNKEELTKEDWLAGFSEDDKHDGCLLPYIMFAIVIGVVIIQFIEYLL